MEKLFTEKHKILLRWMSESVGEINNLLLVMLSLDKGESDNSAFLTLKKKSVLTSLGKIEKNAEFILKLSAVVREVLDRID
jgi:hypothetical protein